MGKGQEYGIVPFDRIEAETEMARLFVIGDKKVWIPNSLSDVDGKEVYVRMWFLEKEGLEDWATETGLYLE